MLNSIKLNNNVTILAERDEHAPIVEYTVITNNLEENSVNVFSFAVSNKGIIVDISPVELI